VVVTNVGRANHRQDFGRQNFSPPSDKVFSEQLPRFNIISLHHGLPSKSHHATISTYTYTKYPP
jgi:splicing factor 3A subunit 2